MRQQMANDKLLTQKLKNKEDVNLVKNIQKKIDLSKKMIIGINEKKKKKAIFPKQNLNTIPETKRDNKFIWIVNNPF